MKILHNTNIKREYNDHRPGRCLSFLYDLHRRKDVQTGCEPPCDRPRSAGGMLRREGPGAETEIDKKVE